MPLAPFKKAQERFKRALASDTSCFGSEGSPLSKACFYALESGGKRFRPAIVYMMAEARGKDNPGIDMAAKAVEFFHTASLIADDLPMMDDDDERRGRPSLHKVFGESTALLASYALIAEGYRMLKEGAALSGRLDQLPEALENVAKNTGALGATGGQYLDLFSDKAAPEAIKRVLEMKTGTLFEVAFVLGWLFSGGDKSNLPVVQALSGHFGLAFQIADDLDDLEADLAAGRQVNLAVILGKEAATSALKKEAAEFKAALSALNLSPKELIPLIDSLLG